MGIKAITVQWDDETKLVLSGSDFGVLDFSGYDHGRLEGLLRFLADLKDSATRSGH